MSAIVIMALILSITMYLVGDKFVKNEFLDKSEELTSANSRIAQMILEKKAAILANAVHDMQYIFSQKTDLLLNGDINSFESEVLNLYDKSFADNIDIFFFRSVDGNYLFDASSPFFDTSYIKKYMVANNIFLNQDVSLIQSESSKGTLLALTGAAKGVSQTTGELAGYFYIGTILNNSDELLNEILETASISEAAIIYGDSVITGNIKRDKNEVIKSCYNQTKVIFNNDHLLDCSDITLKGNSITLKFYQSMPESFISNVSRQYRIMAYLTIFLVLATSILLGYIVNLTTVKSLYRLVDYTKDVLSGETFSIYKDSVIFEFNLLANHISTVNEDLSETQAYLKNLINSAYAPISVWDKNGNISIFNYALEKLSGLSSEDVTGKHISSIYSLFPQLTVPVASTYKSSRFESTITNNKTGEERYILWNITDVFTDSQYSGTILQGVDITKRKKAEQEMELASKVFENAHDGMTIIDPSGYIVSCNSAFINMTGYNANELLGQNANMFRCEKHSDEFYASIIRNLIKDSHWSGELWMKSKSGKFTPVIMTISGIKNSEGKLINFTTSSHDITERKTYEDRIKYQATHDNLTGLPNRNFFMSKLQETIEENDGYSHTAILFLDIDNFKNLNDTLGHATGDRVLEIIAERIKNRLKPTSFCARLSGDEFAVLFTELKNKEDAAHKSKRLIDSVYRPIILQDYELFIHMSAGLCHYPENGRSASELIKNAEIAMYQAKQKGRNNIQTYTAGMDSALKNRLLLESKLNRAIQNEEFTVFYQPKIDLADMQVMGMEALLRWNNPELGNVPPSTFIPLAEENGLILPIGQWVMEQSIKDTVLLHSEGFNNLKIAVNLSIRQFMKKDIISIVSKTLEENGLNGKYFEFEITENIFTEDLNKISYVMNEMSKMNLKFAIDDFGTGYSSISYLKKMPISTLKIDKSFVDYIDSDAENESIVSSVILMAKSLGISVVAEGAETEAQVELLKQMGCNIVQGYFFGKPMPLEEFRQFLKDWQ
ncbi:MAG: hypothetical protein C0602_04445 [Denitrovibrio sp.]|nr:MAG: hypothetical protein C0602_04445 [Denitrovibrio sp.]